MKQKMIVFDASWLKSAQAIKASNSWVTEVINTLDTEGTQYLSLLRSWFGMFPLNSNKQKKGLRVRLESFKNEDHLGAVNELSWWKFMQRIGLRAIPIPPSNKQNVHKPDFYIEGSVDFFAEVSTLNVSAKDKRKFDNGEPCKLEHSETLRRIVSKVVDEKQLQISYAANEKQPCALVLFDYTTWSGLGTQFFRFLADYLLGKEMGFKGLPAELSVLIYIERMVRDGRIGISQDQSAIYYNPNPKYSLLMGTFEALNQFWYQMITAAPKFIDHWVWL